MEKIVTISQVSSLSKKIKKGGKTIVLVGGCFDVLHFGHIRFLKKAKQQGDVLVVALEPDSKVKRLKGKNRPFNNEKIRAEILSSLKFVDYVLILSEFKKDKNYFELTEKIRPDVIAITSGDPQLKNKKKQAKLVGGKLKIVIPRIKTYSSTELAKTLNTSDGGRKR